MGLTGCARGQHGVILDAHGPVKWLALRFRFVAGVKPLFRRHRMRTDNGRRGKVAGA
jgi:hypothetical protein